MPISPQQQYTDYGLLMPRNTIRFRDVSNIPGVRVEPFSSGIETKVKPVVITAGEGYDFEGVASGGRSGLLIVDGIAYKVKGCAIEDALESEGIYKATRVIRVPNRRDVYDAKGGQLLSNAENEIEWTHNFNETLVKGGFPVLQEPEAIIHYGKGFRLPTFINDVVELSLWKYLIKPEELAASVMRVKGDTRLPELYMLDPNDYEAASTVAYRLGLMSGAQKRLTENKFFWGTFSNSIGNLVLFVEDGKIYLAMTDFEDTKKYNAVRNQRVRVHPDAKFKTLKELERLEILKTLDLPALRILQGNRNAMGPAAPEYFKQEFTRGFLDGYKNPDKREPITLEMLVEAFDFNTQL